MMMTQHREVAAQQTAKQQQLKRSTEKLHPLHQNGPSLGPAYALVNESAAAEQLQQQRDWISITYLMMTAVDS